MQDSKQLIQKVAQEIEASSRTSPTAAGPAEQTRAQPTDDHIDALNEVFTLFRINYHNQYYKAYSDTQVLNQIKKLWLESLTRFEPRSEEHTSELQSRGHLVCRLLLEKKK